MATATTYEHTQTGKFHWLLLGIGGAMFLAAWWWRSQLPVVLLVVALLMALAGMLLAFAVRSLTIRDEGHRLGVHFGPLPLLSQFIDYDRITWVAVGRTSIVDGWGIHYVPMRGWTYNVWGFDCVVVYQGDRIIRVGTDDPRGLYEFLKTRIGQKET